MNATEKVTADEWADYLSDFKGVCSEVKDGDDSLMLFRLPNRTVLGMVRYKPNGEKQYSIRKGGHTQFPQYLVARS